MVIAGAGGHAKEILGLFAEKNLAENIYFFDDISKDNIEIILEKYKILKTIDELQQVFKQDNSFVLGVGNPSARKIMTKKLISAGGRLISVISPFARIGKSTLADGLNIMTGAVITQDVIIGKGTLVHINVTIHHDCTVGEFCELSPGCHILGKVAIGDCTSVGAGAILLPGVKVGKNVIIGAGAVVTKNIGDGLTVKGIPAL